MPRDNKLQWLQWLMSRQAARRTEWNIRPNEEPTSEYAQMQAATLIRWCHYYWGREKREMGL